MSKWQIGPVKLANGEDAFVDAINEGQEDWRYTGRVRNHSGDWIACGWHANGRFMFAGKDHECNLAPPPKKTVRVKLFVNANKDGTFQVQRSRQLADEASLCIRIACKEIDIEVTEGDGL
jgi:hypothetical protein